MRTPEIDDRIIDILTYNADFTHKEIAKKLGLNATTVRKRILALKRSGVIRRFMLEVDEESLGRKLSVVLAIDVDSSKFVEVARRLAVIPEVAMAYQTSGSHDVILLLWTKDRESLTQFIKNINSIDGITNVVPSFILERLR